MDVQRHKTSIQQILHFILNSIRNLPCVCVRFLFDAYVQHTIFAIVVCMTLVIDCSNIGQQTRTCSGRWDLQVLQSRNVLRPNVLVGSFKLDVATVWLQKGKYNICL